MNKLPEIKITYEDFKHLIKVLKEKLDIDFSNYNKVILKRRIEYFYTTYNYLIFPKFVERLITNKKTFEKFLNEVLIPTTELFRDPQMWTKLKDKILPKLLTDNNLIKVWFPDITTDDELFTFLILWEEFSVGNEVKITATSPFDNILQKFNSDIQINKKKFENSLQNYYEFNPNGNFEKYFIKNEDLFIFKKKYFQNVKFLKFDFEKNKIFDTFDLIIYRNRMLYYNLKMQNTALDKIDETLKKNGFLIIGHKESLKKWAGFDKYKQIIKGEQIYQKTK